MLTNAGAGGHAGRRGAGRTGVGRVTIRSLIGAEMEGERQGVDEEAHHLFQLGQLAAAHGGADAQRGLARQAVQQQCPDGQQCHERRGVLLAGMLAQAGHQGFGQVQPFGAAQAAHAGRALAVGRNVQGRQFRIDDRKPVVDLFLQRVALQELVVPAGEIAVIDGQRWQRIGGAGLLNLVRIQGRHFLIEQVEGPAVPDDVMRHEEPDMLLVGQPEHAGTEERRAMQRNRFLSERIDGMAQCCFLVLTLKLAEVHGREERDLQVVHHALLGHALGIGVDDGAQDWLTLHQLVEGTLEGVFIQLAGEAMGRRRVVDRGVGIDRLQEVEPLLHQRQRRNAAVGTTSDGVSRLGGRCVTGGQEGRLVGGVDGLVAFAFLQPGGQLQRRGRLEQRGQRDLAAQFTTQRLQQLGGQQRMATHGEEVVIGSHLGQTQVFGHQRLHARQQRGHRGGRRCGVGRCGRGTCCTARGAHGFA